MKAFNYNDDSINYEVVQLVEGGDMYLFTDLRIDRDTIPKHLHAYDVRHSDDWGEAVSVEEFVLVNHMGTIIGPELKELPVFLCTDDELSTFNYTGEEAMPYKQLIDRPPYKVKYADVIYAALRDITAACAEDADTGLYLLEWWIGLDRVNESVTLDLDGETIIFEGEVELLSRTLKALVESSKNHDKTSLMGLEINFNQSPSGSGGRNEDANISTDRAE